MTDSTDQYLQLAFQLFTRMFLISINIPLIINMLPKSEKQPLLYTSYHQYGISSFIYVEFKGLSFANTNWNKLPKRQPSLIKQLSGNNATFSKIS